MGTQGASGLKEIFIGSVTNGGVIRNTHTPILAIPHDYEYRPVKTIIFAVDDDEAVSSPKCYSFRWSNWLNAMMPKSGFITLIAGQDSDGIDPTVDMFLGME